MEWNEQCPARGAGLGHAHWRECKPEAGGHPTSDPTTEFAGNVHAYAQCCHCEVVLTNTQVPVRATEEDGVPPYPATADHPYMPTIGGLCGRCRSPQVVHPVTQSREKAEAQAEEFALPTPCPVDHNSVRRSLLIGDDGLIWTRCPSCNTILEAKMATGEAQGRKTGWGRGEPTGRFFKRVEAYVGWLAYLASHGSS